MLNFVISGGIHLQKNLEIVYFHHLKNLEIVFWMLLLYGKYIKIADFNTAQAFFAVCF